MLNCTVYQNAAKNNGEGLRSGSQPPFLFLSRYRISNLHRSSWVLVTLVGAGGGGSLLLGVFTFGEPKRQKSLYKVGTKELFLRIKSRKLVRGRTCVRERKARQDCNF